MINAPLAWRARIESERTTFTFRANTYRALFVYTFLFAAPFAYLGQSMTIAAIREGNWGLGSWIVAIFTDLLALGAITLVVLSIGWTRITIGEGHVAWHEGPVLRYNERLTFEEAMSLAAFSRGLGRGAFVVDFSFKRGGREIKRVSTMQYAHALFLVDRIREEITRRDPEILARILSAEFLPPSESS